MNEGQGCGNEGKWVLKGSALQRNYRSPATHTISWINMSQSIGSAALNLVVVWFTGQQTLAYMSHWLKVTFAGSIFPVAPILSRSQAHSSIQLVFPCNLVHCRLRSTLSMVNPFLCPFTCSLAIGQTRAAFFYHLHVCLKLKPYQVTTLDNSSHWCIHF